MQYSMLAWVCGGDLCASFHLTNSSIGWFNLIQKGYLHRDISIGNVVMVDDAVTTQAFGILKNEGQNVTVEGIAEALQALKIDSSTKATLEDRLKDALCDLGITDKCHGFVIDGDMAIKIADYFNKEHSGSHSVRWNFKFCYHGSDCMYRVHIRSCPMTS